MPWLRSRQGRGQGTGAGLGRGLYKRAAGARRGVQISEIEASLVYKVSSRTARDTQRNPV